MNRWGGIICLLGVLLVRCYFFYIGMLPVSDVDLLVVDQVFVDRSFFVKSTVSGDRMVADYKGRDYLFIFDDELTYDVGDQLLLDVQYRDCRAPVNPGVFNYCNWLIQEAGDIFCYGPFIGS